MEKMRHYYFNYVDGLLMDNGMDVSDIIELRVCAAILRHFYDLELSSKSDWFKNLNVFDDSDTLKLITSIMLKYPQMSFDVEKRLLYCPISIKINDESNTLLTI